jgi:hypothetical protein
VPALSAFEKGAAQWPPIWHKCVYSYHDNQSSLLIFIDQHGSKRRTVYVSVDIGIMTAIDNYYIY